MKPRFSIGLIAGAVGLLVNVCVATAIGICGPVVSLLAGAAAGYFAARRQVPLTKSDGAKIGAMSGGLAGAVALVGQVIGALSALVLLQQMGAELPLGQLPGSGTAPGSQVGYYAIGAATGLCFGLVGVILAAGAGAGAAYLGTKAGPVNGTTL
ncbi:MAG: hypothetical protein ACUVX9_13635 [Anaerolineae bacterium]|mgnify:CR=1 FL=1